MNLKSAKVAYVHSQILFSHKSVINHVFCWQIDETGDFNGNNINSEIK